MSVDAAQEGLKNPIAGFIYCLPVGVQCRKTLAALEHTRQSPLTLSRRAWRQKELGAR